MTSGNNRIVKHRASDRLYEVDHVVFSTRGWAVDDVYCCYQLSAYDGMPVGERKWIPCHEFDRMIAPTTKGGR